MSRKQELLASNNAREEDGPMVTDEATEYNASVAAAVPVIGGGIQGRLIEIVAPAHLLKGYQFAATTPEGNHFQVTVVRRNSIRSSLLSQSKYRITNFATCCLRSLKAQ
jgi:hypothetical protein